MSLADGTAWEAEHEWNKENLHSVIDHKKVKAIERIRDTLNHIEKDYLKVVDVQYFQTLDNKNGISIITELEDQRYNKKEQL